MMVVGVRLLLAIVLLFAFTFCWSEAQNAYQLNTTDAAQLWEQTLGSVRTGSVNSGMLGSAVDQNDGTVIFTGYATGTLLGHTNVGLYDAFVIKMLPSTGAVIWSRWLATAQYDHATGVCVDTAGNIAVSGNTMGYLNGQTNHNPSYYDHFIAKFSADGTLQWTQLYGTNYDENAGGCQFDSSGSLYVVGQSTSSYQGTNSYSGYWSVYVMKINPAGGSIVWGRNLGATQMNQWLYNDNLNAISGSLPDKPPAGRGIAIIDPIPGATSSPIVIVTGYTDGIFPDAPNLGDQAGYDSFVAAYSSLNGSTLWVNRYGTSADDVVFGVDTDSAGATYVCGYSNANLEGLSVTGATDIWLSKITLTGAKLWTRLYGTTGRDFASACVTDNSGGVYVAGYSEMFSSAGLDGTPSFWSQVYGSYYNYGSTGNMAGFLSKFDSDGSRLWTSMFSSSTPSTVGYYPPYTLPMTMAVDQASQQIYIGGRKTGYMRSDPIVTGITSAELIMDSLFTIGVQQTPTNCTLEQFDSLLTQINTLLVGL